MYIISWNVAGLSPLTNRIHSSYNPPVTSDKKSASKVPPSVALQNFMTRHGADVFCLQEHKIPRKQLSSRSEPRGCSTVEGYESFWSCCVDQNKRGLNGVVTYARKGLVVSADSSPLGSRDLDEQGRCVMTDHGNFVLFNVYVPASGGQPLEYKMRFLQALRRAMAKQRKQNKPVILVGDLNIKHTVLDIPWKDRLIYVDTILNEVAAPGSNLDESFPLWKRQLAQAWPKICKVLETKRAVPKTTTNPRTGETFDKFRLTVTVDGRQVELGSHERTEVSCDYYYDFTELFAIDPETNQEFLAKEANVVCVHVLAELMSKIANINWDIATQRLISNTCGTIRQIDPPREWLDQIIQEDGMVDTFRHFYPTAEDRFTCWDQSSNRRYENIGVRLDYMLVDSCLLQHVLKGDVPSLSCGRDGLDPLGQEAALCAATANGAFRPASFAGGGIGEAPQKALDTQFASKHTGIIYTPPGFSDHVGVSLLLQEECCRRDLTLNEQDVATRKAQPHKTQPLMSSFISKPADGAKRSASFSSTAEKFRSAVKKPKQQSIASYFNNGGMT